MGVVDRTRMPAMQKCVTDSEGDGLRAGCDCARHERHPAAIHGVSWELLGPLRAHKGPYPFLPRAVRKSGLRFDIVRSRRGSDVEPRPAPYQFRIGSTSVGQTVQNGTAKWSISQYAGDHTDCPDIRYKDRVQAIMAMTARAAEDVVLASGS